MTRVKWAGPKMALDLSDQETHLLPLKRERRHTASRVGRPQVLADTAVTQDRERILRPLGFRFGISGPHAARTMMLADLRVLLAHVPAESARADFADAIVADNVLGKPTRKSRELAFRHLTVLYALDPDIPLYRALRRLWPLNPLAQPLLALCVALARDPLLRSMHAFILQQPVGTIVSREGVEAQLGALHPDRFSAASRRSFAQNVAGTWLAAGLLSGRVHKSRISPSIYPENITLCAFMGYLEGRSGQRIFSSPWMQALDVPIGTQELLVQRASERDLLLYRHAGEVQEMGFPGYLRPEESHLRGEVARVL